MLVLRKKRQIVVRDNKNTQKNNVDNSEKMRLVAAAYKGPLPPPVMLSQYDQVCPGAAKKIIEDFTENTEHIRAMEKKDLESSITVMKRGQVMAFVLSIFLMGLAALSLWLGNTTFAGIAGISFLALVVKAFIK